MSRQDSPGAPELDTNRVTPEVGDEGGSPGDVERRQRSIGTGSEATELWRPAEEENQEVPRDETGIGRRSP